MNARKSAIVYSIVLWTVGACAPIPDPYYSLERRVIGNEKTVLEIKQDVSKIYKFIVYRFVVDYVVRKHGWAEDDFHLEVKARDQNVLVVFVVHKDDSKLVGVVGGGKSFGVEFDLHKMKVIKEYGLV